jgi:hypothetical protein
MRIGTITVEAAAAWRREREAATTLAVASVPSRKATKTVADLSADGLCSIDLWAEINPEATPKTNQPQPAAPLSVSLNHSMVESFIKIWRRTQSAVVVAILIAAAGAAKRAAEMSVMS